MGIKGDKMDPNSVISAELLMDKLSSISGITNKKMFGGHGIFHDGKMFGLIDSKGKAFLKADDSIREALTAKGAVQHSRMPYYSITDSMLEDLDELIEWAKKAIEISK